MIIALTLLVAIVGVLMFAISANPKLVRIGEIMFACGLLAFLLNGAEQLIKIISH